MRTSGHVQYAQTCYPISGVCVFSKQFTQMPGNKTEKVLACMLRCDELTSAFCMIAIVAFALMIDECFDWNGLVRSS
jgi:hypothetical protein